jgi:hypothetical protein
MLLLLAVAFIALCFLCVWLGALTGKAIVAFDAGASVEDREVRKRKLIEGPSAFRSTRKDR